MQALEEIFYNPKTGYCGLKKLIERAKHLHLDHDEIETWYKSQSVNQVYKTEKSNSNIPFTTNHQGRIVADLIDISLLHRKNDNYKWILTCLDARSRFTWAFPMKRKNPDEVLEYLKEINRKYKIHTLTVDDGGEFKGSVSSWCEKKGIEIWIANPKQNTKNRTALVESFNRRLLRILFKHMNAKNSYRWIDILDDAVVNCNFGNSLDVQFVSRTKMIDEFEIGDTVRIVIPRTVFSKPTREPTWSQELYQILSRDHARYILVDENFKVIKLHYLPRQLMKVKIIEPITLDEWNDKMGEMRKTNEKYDAMAEARLEKSFVKKQRQTGLDIDSETGIIDKYHKNQPATEKRIVKKPARYTE